MRTPYWLIYFIAVTLLFGLSLFIPSDVAIPISNQISDAPKASMDLLSSMTALITALNTSVVGAAAALAVKGKDWSNNWTRTDGLLVLTVFILSAVSYYGIYLGYVALMSMVSKGTLYLMETRLQWAIALQYYGTLAGVFVLGLVFTRLLEGTSRRSQ